MKTTSATKHLLLIEPDTVQAGLITRALSSTTLKVHLANSAQTAITEADSHRPDAVVLELALPSHNGIEFLHEFRSYQEWADIPVVIFSQQHVDDKAIFNALGPVAYFYKPQTSLAGLKMHLQDLLK